MDKDKENIQVMVRVRPLNEHELSEGSRSCILLNEENPNLITIDTKPEPKTFFFDYSGGEKLTQKEVFQIVGSPSALAAVEGYNVCIFAYGQTGTGKTYTMLGNIKENEHKGLQIRVFEHIFHLANQFRKENTCEFVFKCNFFEIYNEQISDLLSDNFNNLQVREDLKKGPYIEGITEEIVNNPDELIQLLLKGTKNRHVGSTLMNSESSRSHCVFSCFIESKKIHNGVTNVKISKLNFVDLAGSERQTKTAAFGERLKEATNINKSLTVLGCVINSLVEISQGKTRHIPYRDSKLTFILRDSLGGNSRTFMIANISAASSSFAETLSTLKFAQRAKMIKNKALINEEASGNMEFLKKEIKRLKDELVQSTSLINELQNKSSETENTLFKAKLTPNFEVYLQKSLSRQKSSKKIGFFDLNSKLFNDFNIKISEIENNFLSVAEKLKENINSIKEKNNEKDDYLNYIIESLEKYSINEINYLMIIDLNRKKAERNLFDNSEITKNENLKLYEIIKNNNSVWALLKLMKKKKKKRQLSFKKNNIIDENNDLISKLILKIENFTNENIKYKEELKNFIQENYSSYFNENCQKSIAMLTQKINGLNEENIMLKHKENQMNRLLENEKITKEDLIKNQQKLEEQINLSNTQYENKVAELFHKFSSKDKKYLLNDFDLNQNVSDQDFRIYELEELSQKKSSNIEKLELRLCDQKIQIENILKEKNVLEDEINRINSAKILLETNYFKEIETINQELQIEKINNVTKNENINCLEEELVELRIEIDQLYKDKDELIKEKNKLNEEINTEIINLNNKNEMEKEINENLENEKRKIQEEYDTLLQAYNYEKEINIEFKNKLIHENNELTSKIIIFEEQKEIINKENLKYKEKKEEQIEILDSKILFYEGDILRKEQENNILLDENCKLNRIITDKDFEIFKLKETINCCNSQIEESLTSVMNMQNYFKNSKEKIDFLTNENSKIINENQDFKYNIENLNKKLQIYSEKNNNMVDRIKELEENLFLLNHKLEIINANYKIVINENAKLKEEIKIFELEKDSFILQLEKIKEENIYLKEMKNKSEKQIGIITKELEELTKTNNSLIGHNNPEQKIKHINKLKEENNKLKNEKEKQYQQMESLKNKLEKYSKNNCEVKFSSTNFFKEDDLEIEKNMLNIFIPFIRQICQLFKIVPKLENLQNINKDLEDILIQIKIILSKNECNLQDKERKLCLTESKLNAIKMDYNIYKKKQDLENIQFSPSKLSNFNSNYISNRISENDIKILDIFKTHSKKKEEKKKELNYPMIKENQLKKLKFDALKKNTII